MLVIDQLHGSATDSSESCSFWAQSLETAAHWDSHRDPALWQSLDVTGVKGLGLQMGSVFSEALEWYLELI